MKEIIKNIKDRRSIYDISNEAILSDEELVNIIKEITKDVPSPFNIQTQRVVILLNKEHEALWDLTFDELKAKTEMPDPAKTREKLDGFKSGYGTILFFEDDQSLTEWQDKFPAYSENFVTWSSQANGMLQYALWTTLEAYGYGASLQHYNPIIDDAVKAKWDINSKYRLVAQLPFGKPNSYPDAKEYIDQDIKVQVKK